MKRNWDLIRDILLTVERSEPDDAAISASDIDKSYALDEVQYHIATLIESGLVKGVKSDEKPIPQTAFLFNLTWDGHNFAEQIRDEKFWKKVKGISVRKTGDLSFETIKIGIKLALEQLLDTVPNFG